MKKTLTILAVSLSLLAGCAAPRAVDQAFEETMQYAQSSDAMAKAGTITWESRYTRLFEMSAGIQHPTVRRGYRSAYSDMIPVARRFDAQQITESEFADARRQTSMKLESTRDSAGREIADAQMRQSAAMLQVLQNNQAQQNQFYQQQMQQIQNNKPINCTSTAYGNTVQTNCR